LFTFYIFAFRHQKISYSVTTPFESFKKLLSKKIFVKNNISSNLYEIIAQESFRMITCQLFPFVPFNVIQFSKNIYRSKTKYQLIKKLRTKYNDTIYEIDSEMKEWIKQACIVYINNIFESLRLYEFTENIFINYEETLEDIYQMTLLLYEMGMPCLDESEIRLRYNTDETSEIYQYAFEKFKQNGYFTLTDDLYASFKLIKLLDAHNILIN
jgi:hypothetical protein